MQKITDGTRVLPVLEVIASSVSDAIEAQRGGADRLELIRDFKRGGLTPPLKLVEDILAAVTLPVRVMLREEVSYEVESEAAIERLCAGARGLAKLNIDGLVLGFLREGKIDVQLTPRVLSCAPNLPATFHHAFEDAGNHSDAIRILKTMNQVDRILTSGGSGGWSNKVARLSAHVEAANPEIQILAGGGMNEHSIRTICQATTICEFHVGRAARVPPTATGVVQAARVRALVEALRESC
jgi:copper homeostasis protein